MEGQAGLLGDRHNTGSRQKNKKQERTQALRVYSRIPLCLLVHNHLLPIYRGWIVQSEWELACVLIWSWENKLPAILECGRVGIFSIMACPRSIESYLKIAGRSIEGSVMDKRNPGLVYTWHQTLWNGIPQTCQANDRDTVAPGKKAKWRKTLAEWLNQKAKKQLQGSNDCMGMWYCNTQYQLSTPPRI